MHLRVLIDYLNKYFKQYYLDDSLSKQSFLLGFKEGAKKKSPKVTIEDLKKMIQLSLKRKPRGNYDIEFKSYLRGLCDGMDANGYIKAIFSEVEEDVENIIKIFVMEELTQIRKQQEEEKKETEDEFIDLLLYQMERIERMAEDVDEMGFYDDFTMIGDEDNV